MGFLFKTPEERVARLLEKGLSAARTGAFDRARADCEAAWNLAVAELDVAQVRTDAAMALVNVCVAMQDWPAAEHALVRLCTSLLALRGPDTLEVVSAQRTLCDLYVQRGKPAEAIAVLEGLVARLPPRSANALHLKAELAGIVSKAGDAARARTLITEVMTQVEKMHPAGHPERAWAQQCAATIALRSGDLETAHPLAVAAYAGARVDEHRLASGLTLVDSLRRRREFAAAINVCEELPAVSQDPVSRATVIETMADVLRDSGALHDAVPLYERATQMVNASFGPNHFNLITLLEGHAATLRLMGRLTQANELDAQRRAIEQAVRRPSSAG